MNSDLRVKKVATPPIQKRTLTVLMIAQALGGLGVGATLTVGTGLVTHASGNESISGFAPTMATLGAAIAGIPLARLAVARGRRFALATGNLIALFGAILIIVAAAASLLPLILLGLLLTGFAAAVQLQSRFAATDLSLTEHQGRDLSLIVWSTTVGAVIGPELVGPGEAVGHIIGLPVLTGGFLFTGIAQVAAVLVLLLFLRPDPLLEAQKRAALNLETAEDVDSLDDTPTHQVPVVTGEAANPTSEHNLHGRRALGIQQISIAIIALSQAVMVALMAMTAGHLTHHGFAVEIIGITVSIHIAGMYAFSPLFGYLVDKTGRRFVILFGAAQLVAAAILAAISGDSLLTLQIGLLLLGTGWSAVTVAGSALLTRSTPTEIRPKRQGQSDALMNLAGASAGAIAGFIFAAGGYPLLSVFALVVIATLVALTLALFALIPRR